MSHQTLAEIWFMLWAFLWATYFTFEGYIVGVGTFFPFLAKKKEEENQLKNTIGPFWDGHEVWLIVAGGVTFATFSKTYSLLLSSFYIPIYLVLFALIFRGPGIEFMDKVLTPSWRKKWMLVLCGSSFLIPFLFGVAFSTIFSGLPINEKGLHLTFFDVINVYSLLGGATYTILSLLAGVLWVALKTRGPLQEKTARLAKIFWMLATFLLIVFYIVFIKFTNLFESFANVPILWIVPALCVLSLLLTVIPLRKKKWLPGFILVSLTIFTFFASGFTGMFPDMLPSYINPKYSLTLYDAAGSKLNLTIMLWIVIFILPLVIAYKVWMYWIFKGKVSEKNANEY